MYTSISAIELLLYLLLVSITVEAQDCTLPSQNGVNQALLEETIVNGGEGVSVTIRGGPYYTCQVQGTTMGTYQELSIIMEYTDNGGDKVSQFEMICVSFGGVTAFSRRTPSTLTLLFTGSGVTYDGSFGLRTDCSSCTNQDNPDNDNNCQACNSTCNVGLMRCTGGGADDCCAAFEDNGDCSPDTDCDNTNFVATAQNNFTCECSLISCDPGYSITTNSSGCYCVLSDICMTQPSPCNNNGSCTLTSPPDNFTCDCTGTRFTGDTCDEEERAVCTPECNPDSDELPYYQCCLQSNLGGFVRIIKSGIVRRYLACPTVAPDWCTEPTSCADIKTRNRSTISGEYEVVNANGEMETIYCSFETYCGSDEGWNRVAYLNMSDPLQSCPDELEYYTKGSLRVCGRQTSSGPSCSSVIIPTKNVSYSEVCGRVTGYQHGQTGALHKSVQDIALRDDINSYYMDGVSLTRGSPRKHIWTFMAGNEEQYIRESDCPCNTGFNVISVPSFISDDYFCESSYPTFASEWTFITSDPLWDNDQYCNYLEGPCCTGFPWFHKVLDAPTTDYLEFRICSDNPTSVDTPVSLYEIYVK